MLQISWMALFVSFGRRLAVVDIIPEYKQS